MNPLVSIVIPCYRQGRWLSSAIESCQRQTYQSLEIIVINDGSDDDTEAVAKKYHNIRYYYQKNAGQSSARNHGLQYTNGEYVLFLDADDALHPEAVEKLMAAAGGSNCIAMIGWKPFETDVNESGTEVLPPLVDPIPSVLRNNPGPPHMFLSPKKTLDAVGGWDPNLTGTSDWDCWFRQLFAGADLIGVPFLGAYYRQSPGQLSRNELVMSKNLALASEKLYRLAAANPARLKGWNLDPSAIIPEFRGRVAKEYAHLAYLHRQRGERAAAARNYWKSLQFGFRRTTVSGLLALPFRSGVA